MVALVNQWHMEGIEHNWAHSYGQVPRSVHFTDINPIGDMDMRRGLFYMWYNYSKRMIGSANHSSAPSTFSNHLVGYHRETVFHYEHRDM